MNRILMLIFIVISVPYGGYAQSKAMGGYAQNTKYIGFLQFLPDGYNSSTSKFPLIISLHGVGEKGNGTTQLRDVECCGIPNYIKQGNKMRFTWNGKSESFIVLSPQLSTSYGNWQNFYVDELVKYALRSLKVDPDRIFLTGLSLGGGGTWAYASTSSANAAVFAGIVPVVAPCFIKDPCIIARSGLPVFALHALDDTVAKAQCTINAIRMINACRPVVSPNVVLYPSGGHVVFFNKTYDTAHKFQDPNVYEWMLAQNRKLPPNKKPVAILSAASSITSGKGLIILDGTKSYDPDGRLVSCSWERISGPQPGVMKILTPGKAELSGLTLPGLYTFLIKVVDDRAEWSTDTVTISLTAATAVNVPPVANAGRDVQVGSGQVISLSAGSSVDPDGSLVGFQWSLVSGPGAAISNPAGVNTLVQLSKNGSYQFKLQVMDNKGAIATDVVQVNASGNAAMLEEDSDVVSRSPGLQDPNYPVPTYTNYSNQPDPFFKEMPFPDSVNTMQEAILFPNPAGSQFNIKLPYNVSGRVNLVIYNQLGTRVKTIQTFSLKNISVADLAPGLYNVEIISDGNANIHTQLIKK